MSSQPLFRPKISHKYLHCLLLIALLIAQFAQFVAFPSAGVKAQAALASDAVLALRLENGLLMWSTKCSGSGEIDPTTAYVRTLPAAGGSQRTLQTVNTCGVDRAASNLISDSSYFYWQTSNRIVRLARSAAAGSAPQAVANKATANSTGEITQDTAYLYWSENGPSGGALFRVAKSPGATREPLLGEPVAIRSLLSNTNNQLLFIGHQGLVRERFGSGGGITPISSNASAYALDGSVLYWVERVGAGPQLAIRRAAVNGPYTDAPLFTIDGAGNPTVPTIAVDATNLYWFEQRTGGPIYRMPKAGGAPVAITGTLLGIRDLVSSGRDLFWQNNVSIQRLPTNSAPVTVDLVPGPVIEVVQAIQNPLSGAIVPLVQGKETFVRLYARIASGSVTRVTTWPIVTLTGRRDGVTLGQLLPLNAMQPLTSAAMDRTQLNGSFLFRLPAEWTRGHLELSAEVNPRHLVAESNTSNNRISSNFDFTRKAPMCLDMIPVETSHGVSISSWDPGASLQSFFDRAVTLLPTEALRTFWRGGPAMRKPRWYLLDDDPFTVSTSEPDAGWLIFWLNLRTLFDSDPGGCGAANAAVSRIAMLPDFDGREVNGMAGGSSMLFFDFVAAPSAQDVPGGGVTLAHELAHLYGRGHIDCPVGRPTGIDRGYPYPTCQLDANASGNIGFDPITQQLILPAVTGDLMSYAHLMRSPRWSSDYTWRGLFNRVNTRSGMAAEVAAAGLSPAAAASTYVVSGIISGTTVLFNNTYAGTGDLQEQFIRRIGASTELSSDYEVRAYDGAGNLTASTPLAIIHIEEADSTQQPFMTRLDLASDPARIEVAHSGGDAIGSLTAGANPPLVTITSPTAGADLTTAMHVTWNGSDPDGDLLRYVVRYSNDNGASWISLDAGSTTTSLDVDLTGGMPGGEQALVQVLASDGLHTTIATSPLFHTARHAPRAAIVNDAGETLDMSMTVAGLQSAAVVLHGRAYDAEDGPLSEEALQWRISGPISRNGDGEEFTVVDLPPGSYTVELRATDSDGQTALATTTLVITPKRVYEGATPALDGLCDDEGYASDLDPIRLRYDAGTDAESVVEVRTVHGEDGLYLCFGGALLGSSEESYLSLLVDADNSGGDVATPSDFSYTVAMDGSIHMAAGDGAGGFTSVEAPLGIDAVVSRGDGGWGAEMRLGDASLGGWNHLIRLQAGHFGRNGEGDATVWPLESAVSSPNTWGMTALGQQGQIISFDPLGDRQADAPDFTVSATTSSGLPVAFAASGSCSNSRNVITLTGAGSCTVTATQPGDAVYTAAAPVAQSFHVTAAPDEPSDPDGPDEPTDPHNPDGPDEPTDPHNPVGPVAPGGVGLYLPSVVK